jgi:PPOX class probable F420-dependent enzyme
MASEHLGLELVRQLGADSRWLAVVATSRPDGSVHASLVNAGVLDDPPPAVGAGPVIALVAAGGTRKLDLIRRSGRAAVTFHHGWQWVTVEGPAQIAGPDDALPGLEPSEVPELLRAVFRAAGGTHEDWDEYDRVMAADRRAAVLIEPARVLTNRPLS